MEGLEQHVPHYLQASLQLVSRELVCFGLRERHGEAVLEGCPHLHQLHDGELAVSGDALVYGVFTFRDGDVEPGHGFENEGSFIEVPPRARQAIVTQEQPACGLWGIEPGGYQQVGVVTEAIQPTLPGTPHSLDGSALHRGDVDEAKLVHSFDKVITDDVQTPFEAKSLKVGAQRCRADYMFAEYLVDSRSKADRRASDALCENLEPVPGGSRGRGHQYSEQCEHSGASDSMGERAKQKEGPPQEERAASGGSRE
jgi:hypothetical protein